jgi:hypothetical protein
VFHSTLLDESVFVVFAMTCRVTQRVGGSRLDNLSNDNVLTLICYSSYKYFVDVSNYCYLLKENSENRTRRHFVTEYLLDFGLI